VNTILDRQTGRRRINKKHAFTLAEVLIVIGIIGVIANMTIPTLVKNVAKQEMSARLKKYYSSMSQAILLSSIDNGPSTDWQFVQYGTNVDSLDFFNNYFAKYMRYSKIDSNFREVPAAPLSTKVYFDDGSAVKLSMGTCVDHVFDANGDKNPNKSGYDQFVFLFCTGTGATSWFGRSDKTFGAYGEGKTRAQALSDCITAAYYCSSLLILDNWEFKDDYPYK